MLRAFLRAPSGILGLTSIAVILIIAIIAPPLWGDQASAINLTQPNQNPSLQNWAGTDSLGRDIFLRVLVATRLSIGLALAAAGLGALIGITGGIGASLLRSHARSTALRTIDTLLAFPGILIAIFIGAITGPGALGAALGVGIAISFSFARVSSALAMSVGGREYVSAARVTGIRPLRMMFRYVFPNIAEVLVITTTVAISNAIVQVSSLSFLGLGVQAPQYDWGRMLTEGVQAFYTTPAAALAPLAAIALSALAFGFTGEALARAMNPVLWSRKGGGAVESALQTAQERVPNFGQNGVAHPPTGIATSDGLTLEVSDLIVEFPGHGRPIRVVDGVSFVLHKGEMLGIVGESGSGKTMTSMAIAQLVPHPGVVSGSINLNGQKLDQMTTQDLDRLLGSNVAVVFQDPMSSLNPALRVGTQLTEAVEVHQRIGKREAVDLAVGRLREVNVAAPEHQLQRYPHELSGGMRQRVMIAMGLMTEPALVIADEPTTALDVTIQAQIMDVLNGINRQHGTAIILISHNLGLISQNCQRVLVMYAGRIMEDLTIEQLSTQPLHPYTKALLATVPDLDQPRQEPLATIQGQPPDMSALPAGCAFHPRCPAATERCAAERPPLILRPDGQRVACWVANEDLE
jgi:oligopeptide/dipeptide ABC transporter ATP-binding protein